jgi:hypothetical protein
MIFNHTHVEGEEFWNCSQEILQARFVVAQKYVLQKIKWDEQLVEALRHMMWGSGFDSHCGPWEIFKWPNASVRIQQPWSPLSL